MEDGKRRAYICQQAAVWEKKQKEEGVPPKGTGLVNPFTKRKSSDKIDRHPKKLKVVMGSTVEETPDSNKLPPLPRLGKGKGLMMGQGPVTEKHPVLFCEDSRYAIKQLLSIIKDDDYEDLGNHVTEVIGETSLFSLAQVCISVLLSLPSYCSPFS